MVSHSHPANVNVCPRTGQADAHLLEGSALFCGRIRAHDRAGEFR